MSPDSFTSQLDELNAKIEAGDMGAWYHRINLLSGNVTAITKFVEAGRKLPNMSCSNPILNTTGKGGYMLDCQECPQCQFRTALSELEGK